MREVSGARRGELGWDGMGWDGVGIGGLNGISQLMLNPSIHLVRHSFHFHFQNR